MSANNREEESAAGAGGGSRRSRRYPANMQGVLQMSIANSTTDDNRTESSNAVPMSEERRQWLNQALSDMSVDVIREMKQNLDNLRSADATTEVKEVSLDNLIEWCENLDLAQDFHKIGGYESLGDLLRDENPEIRSRAADLIATLVQNNPYCQQRALEFDLMPSLLALLDDDNDDRVKIKALYAVSCMAREFDAGKEEFVKNDGFSHLLRAMQLDVEKLQIKAVFLLKALCVDESKYKDMLCDMGMVEQLVGLLITEHKPFHEHLLGALVNLVDDADGRSSRLISECRRPEFELRKVLLERIELVKGHDEYREEKEYAEKLLGVCFGVGDNSAVSEQCDR
ncbi:hsp70-binding protein 1-like [Tubulanus polymorphus]|uniref:hsp70-binding protein 1-like n=1 Tax=Tubulanus polymorphus TaxID=672921 RepID=UPI003DA4F89C